MAGPIFVNSSTFSAGTNAFTVTSNPRNVMVVWGQGSFGPNNTVPEPVITYNGASIIFGVTPAYQLGGGISYWIGYLVNPDVGTFNIISNGACCISVFYDVDQSNPLFLTSTTYSNSTSPSVLGATSLYDNSLLLKSYLGNTTLSYSDGAGETSVFTLGSGRIRGSYLPTTTAGAYSMATAYSGGGNNVFAMQIFELKWGGVLSSTASVFQGNSASRVATPGRSVTLTRALTDSIGVGAGRLVTQGRAIFSTLTVSIGNAASRFATATSSIKVGWHSLVKNVSSWSNTTKNVSSFSATTKTTNPVLASAGLIMGALAMTYSGTETLTTTGGNITWTNVNKS